MGCITGRLPEIEVRGFTIAFLNIGFVAESAIELADFAR